jgi:hypothetical protein
MPHITPFSEGLIIDQTEEIFHIIPEIILIKNVEISIMMLRNDLYRYLELLDPHMKNRLISLVISRDSTEEEVIHYIKHETRHGKTLRITSGLIASTRNGSFNHLLHTIWKTPQSYIWDLTLMKKCPEYINNISGFLDDCVNGEAKVVQYLKIYTDSYIKELFRCSKVMSENNAIHYYFSLEKFEKSFQNLNDNHVHILVLDI